MKKPKNLKINFPRCKGTLNSGLKKYFNSLDGKVLEIDFAKERCRKIFEYKIVGVGFSSGYWINEKNDKERVSIRLEQIEKEKDTQK